MIDSYEAGKINEALKTFAQSTNNQSISMPAEVLGTDEDGTTWVQVIGGNEKTPLATSTVSLSEGDMVNVTIGNGRAEARGNLTDPSASSTSLGRVEATANEAYQGVGMAVQASEAAQQAAAEAQEVAEAVNQHFWYDTNGAHVTDATQEAWEEEYAKPNHGELANPTDAHPWYNQLLGSAGTLLRSGLKNLVSWTRSANAFYDGLGNAEENIVAQFGANLARIGYENNMHIDIERSAVRVYSDNQESDVPVTISQYGVVVSDIGSNPTGTTTVAPSNLSIRDGFGAKLQLNDYYLYTRNKPYPSGLIVKGNRNEQELCGEWIEFNFDVDATYYDAARKPYYMRSAGFCSLEGAARPVSEVSAGGTLTIGTLPEGFRPKVQIDTLCQGRAAEIYMLRIATDGVVTASRYRNGTGQDIPMGTNAFLSFNVTFGLA